MSDQLSVHLEDIYFLISKLNIDEFNQLASYVATKSAKNMRAEEKDLEIIPGFTEDEKLVIVEDLCDLVKKNSYLSKNYSQFVKRPGSHTIHKDTIASLFGSDPYYSNVCFMYRLAKENTSDDEEYRGPHLLVLDIFKEHEINW